ncbi:hypothetical protein KIW84_041634 [Lathyrus oleraceus]|uniref:BTB domain-containing protein n=1 Tax=Pisum sativum TaxID=3888 RepID=A0A9D5ARW5_PEA|nr:hypothetical protein KIW84_041633 [Pisum sativum]KAI5416679.1 hypothetical protein KIW84_041634 [Pisum sativum]
MNNLAPRRRSSCVPTATRDLWKRLFNEGYKAEVRINTDSSGIVYAHSNIIAVASSVLGGMLKQADRSNRWWSISIVGDSHDAVRVFSRFLYSSCYENEEKKDFSHTCWCCHLYMRSLIRSMNIPIQPTPNDVVHVFSGYAPLSLRLVQHAIRPGGRPVEESLKLLRLLLLKSLQLDHLTRILCE